MRSIQNVVVVEDDSLFQEVIESMIRDRFQGIELVQLGIEGAPRVDQVLQHVRGEMTLVICDRSLTRGGAEGENIVQAVKKTNAQVIMFSSLIPQQVRIQLEALGIPCIDKCQTDSLKNWLDALNTEKNS